MAIIARLDRLEENQDITIRMLRSALSKAGYDDESDDADDIFPTVMKTVQDIEVLETRLQDKIYRRKMVCFTLDKLNLSIFNRMGELHWNK